MSFWIFWTYNKYTLHLNGAIETARGINNSGKQIEALKRVAMDRAAVGDLDGALRVVAEINSPKAEAEALEWVAARLGSESPPPVR